jgi:hypothetical protein
MLAADSHAGLIPHKYAVALLTAAIALLTLLPTPARAAAPIAVGWWEEAQQTPVNPTLPAPPDVPPGGLFVANGAMGAVGISALRFVSPGPGTLRLQVAGNSPGAAVATVDACLPLSAWKAEENGPWRDVPQYDCGNSVTGTVNGTTFEWKLPASHARSSGLQVVLAPHPGLGSPFQVGFEPPGSDAFSPAAGVASVSTTSSPATIPDSSTRPSTSATLAPLIEAIRPVLPFAPSTSTGATVLGETVTRPPAPVAASRPSGARPRPSRHLALVGAGAAGLMAVVASALLALRAISARSSSRL